MSLPRLFAGVIVISILLPLPMRGRSSWQADSPKAKHATVSPVVDCSASLDMGGGTFVELRLTKANLIKELIEEPLRKASPDPHPKDYKINGLVRIKKKNGSEDSFVLFRPWGRLKIHEKYVIADLNGIQKLFKKSLTRGADRLE